MLAVKQSKAVFKARNEKLNAVDETNQPMKTSSPFTDLIESKIQVSDLKQTKMTYHSMRAHVEDLWSVTLELPP